MPKYVVLSELGFPGYRVGDDGSVWTRIATRAKSEGRGVEAFLSASWRELKPAERSKNSRYLFVTLYNSTRKWQASVHILVLLAFVGPCPVGMEGCHQDGNHKNNKLTNLRWGSRKSNALDRIKHGTQIKGTKHPMAHQGMNYEVAKAIRSEYDSGRYSMQQLAIKHQMSKSNICRIVQGKIWSV